MMRAAGLARLFSPADDRQVEFGDETSYAMILFLIYAIYC